MAFPENNDAALGAFVARKAQIDALLDRLAALSAEHFRVAPDDVNWGHVGNLDSYAALLKRMTNSAFQEGEFAQ
jgi:hypothetical protein